jgi:hypothetical protein
MIVSDEWATTGKQRFVFLLLSVILMTCCSRASRLMAYFEETLSSFSRWLPFKTWKKFKLLSVVAVMRKSLHIK